MIRNIYLVRHGEPVGVSQRKIFLGQGDPPLSRNGIEQVEILSGYFKQFAISRVFCSDLARSEETALLITTRLGCQYEVISSFREINLGTWEGATVSEIKKRYPSEFQKRGEDPVNFPPPGGESFVDLQNRVIPSLEKIIKHNTGNLLITTHAGVNKVILTHLLQNDLKQMFNLKQDYGHVHILNEKNTGFTLVKLNYSPL